MGIEHPKVEFANIVNWYLKMNKKIQWTAFSISDAGTTEHPIAKERKRNRKKKINLNTELSIYSCYKDYLVSRIHEV
jgi:hypothetical protein